jgi:cytochrome c peroxidase
MKLIPILLVVGLFLVNKVAAASLPQPVQDSDYYDNNMPNEAKVTLGNLLFFDKILSGNKNISCASCHSPYMAGGDGLSLSVGEGGRFLGPMRTLGEGDEAITTRVGRNAPSLWNVGAREFTHLNWQGVHAYDVDTDTLSLPAGPATPDGLDNVLAGQVLFPLVNVAEMLGEVGDNDIINAAIGYPRGTPFLFPPQWQAIADRLREIPEYVDMFIAAFDDVISGDDITVVHISNAIAAFETDAFRANNSPFDQFLNGDRQALTSKQRAGLDLFYDRNRSTGGAGCWACHSGPFQTDHDFYAIAIPQFGPGVLPAPEFQDYGREEVTRDSGDRFAFRTPSLRNVALTFPYGHNGAYKTLEGIIRHHLDPIVALESWDRSQVVMRKRDDFDAVDFAGYDDAGMRQELADANELRPQSLTDTEIEYLIEFLHALTDPSSLNIHSMIPSEVPSGLAVGD